MIIKLPFPPSSLSGHAKGKHYYAKAKVTAQWRQWAFHAALEAKATAPDDGDIAIHVRFIPPDNRGDRVNFPNRCKPIFDGIADAMKVNDKRFVPSFEFCEPKAPGRVEVFISSSAHTGFEAMKGGQVDADTSEPCPGTVAYKESDHD